MAGKKFTLDYVVKSSPTILYNFLSTPSGLAQWFADHVDNVEDDFSFFWDGNEEKAVVLEKDNSSFIKFKMEDSEAGEYLEFKIIRSEVTGDTILIITDFADEFDMDDQKQLWNAQVSSLITVVGGSN